MSEELLKRVKTVEMLINLTEDFSNMIRYKAMTISDIISIAGKNPEYEPLDFIADINIQDKTERNIHDIWSESVEKSSVLGKKEAEIMLSFGNMLGTSDISGQLSSIEIYKKRLENLLAEFRNDYQQKGRMYRSVGMLLGIMAGIMLL